MYNENNSRNCMMITFNKSYAENFFVKMTEKLHSRLFFGNRAQIVDITVKLQ